MSSSQPRKQVKRAAEAPLHRRRRAFHSHLSKELRQKHGKRSFMVRKGDTARIMSGKFRKRTGKVAKVDLRRGRVTIEGITVKNAKGQERFAALHPSTLELTELDLKDEKRIRALERK